jgi:hypothetical protein
MHQTTPANMRGHWFVPPRPNGWQWGGRGWWGGSYQPPMRGYVMPSFWLSPSYAVSDWDGYGFGAPGGGRRWVRYYDDAVLVDGRGVIHDSIHDVQWGRYAYGPVPQYVGDEPDAQSYYGADYDYGVDDQVTWEGGHSDRQIWAWPSQAQTTRSGTVIVVPPNSVTTIVFQPAAEAATSGYEGPAAPAWRASPRTKIKVRATSKPRVVRRVPVKKG